MRFDLIRRYLVPMALAASIVFYFAGCGSEADPDFTGFSSSASSYHPFGDDTGQHGDYVVSLGLSEDGSYYFSQCIECHGEDLHGFIEGADTVRSCYACHTGETHQVGFTDASQEHPSYLRERNWQIGNCYTCHVVDSDAPWSFGGSCSSAACHPAQSDGPQACNTCHGEMGGDPDNPVYWAPPADLDNSISTDVIGVGAHREHLGNSDSFASVACDNCHKVPQQWDDPGHLEASGIPRAEIVFNGLAHADGSHPRWSHDNATCSSTYCHGDSQPKWTLVDGTYSECGSCHGIPPEAPHVDWPSREQCYICHALVIDNTGMIIAPQLHVNGQIDRN